MRIGRLSRKSQVTMPADWRRRMGLELGDDILMEFDGEQMLVRKNTGSPLKELRSLPREIWAGAADELARSRDEWDR